MARLGGRERRSGSSCQSRISPTMITSGSWRNMFLSASANVGVSVPTSRCETAAFPSANRNSIGSSMVTMCTWRCSMTDRRMPASVVDLPEPVGPVISTRPVGQVDEGFEHLGQVQLVDRGQLERNAAEDGRERTALHVDVCRGTGRPRAGRSRGRPTGALRAFRAGPGSGSRGASPRGPWAGAPPTSRGSSFPLIRSKGGLIGFRWRSDASFVAMNRRNSASFRETIIADGLPDPSKRALSRVLHRSGGAASPALPGSCRLSRPAPRREPLRAAGPLPAREEFRATRGRRPPARPESGVGDGRARRAAARSAGTRGRSPAGEGARRRRRQPASSSQRHASSPAGRFLARSAKRKESPDGVRFLVSGAERAEPGTRLRGADAEPSREEGESEPATPSRRKASRVSTCRRGRGPSRRHGRDGGRPAAGEWARKDPHPPPTPGPGRRWGPTGACRAPPARARAPPGRQRAPRAGRTRRSLDPETGRAWPGDGRRGARGADRP